MSGLQVIPTDSRLACGLGSGTHGGSFAVAGGCASKVNERLAFNFGGSVIPSEQEFSGNGDNWSGRAGFVLKLGQISKDISLKDSKKLYAEIDKLMKSNKSIKEKNEQLIKTINRFSSENNSLRGLIKKLSKRIEKLEKISLK